MEKLFRSGDSELAGHLARPRIAPGTSVPGLLICHGFPNLNQGGALSARSFPELAERIATEMRLVAEQMANGRINVDEAATELDRRADAILTKRRWMLDRSGSP